jgi:chromosome partitioning protein
MNKNELLPPSLAAVTDLEDRTDSLVESLKDVVGASERQALPLVFKMQEAAQMTGRSTQSIRNAEGAGELPEPRLQNGRRLGYSLEEVNGMRDHFGTRPSRASDDPPAILAVQNFKGGVAKTTLTIHAAQYFALQGYRVLLVDCDSQASATLMFGINPDYDIDPMETLAPFLLGESGHDDLSYAIRRTYWPGLDLVPANLSVYGVEYGFIAFGARERTEAFSRLRDGLREAAQDYDIVLVDPPPALGMMSLSVIQASNALLIPAPPSSIDFSSTASYVTMLRDALSSLHDRGLAPDLNWVKVIATRLNENKSTQLLIRDTMSRALPEYMFRMPLLDSAEIDNAASEFRTIYEHQGPRSKTYQRCRRNMDAVMAELELLVRSTWPSHRRTLKAEGLVV